MIKKYLLNTAVAMSFLSTWSAQYAFSMTEMRMTGEVAAISPYDRALGDVPQVQSVGGVMLPRRHQSELLTQDELASRAYTSEGRACFPLFSDAAPSWKTLNYARLKEIVDEQGSSDSDRRLAFNRLSFAVENIMKRIYVSVVKDGENVSELVLNSRSVEENEAIVSIVRLIAKITLWDSVMEPDNPARFNPILDVILNHKEVRSAENCVPYTHYLFKIEKFLEDAIKIQDFLMGGNTAQQHAASDARIKGVLLADRARVFELRLLKRKVQMGLDLKSADSNEIVDPEGILRRNVYTFYHDALSQGASKSCLLGMIKVINDSGYSPSGDSGQDREILGDLLEKYTKHLGEYKRSPRGVFGQLEKAQGNKIVGAIPKPRHAIGYVEALKDKLGLVVEAGPGKADSDEPFSSGDSFLIDADFETDLTSGEVLPAISSEENSQGAGVSSSSRLNEALTIGTSLGVSTDCMPSRVSVKSKHLSPAQQKEIRVFFGIKEDALARYGSYEGAYRSIAQHFGVTTYQVSYAICRQQKYKESRASTRAVWDERANEVIESDRSVLRGSNDSDTDEEWNPSFKRRRKMSQNSILLSSDDEL